MNAPGAADIDLSDYNLGELKGLQFEIEQELRRRRQHAAREARARILAIAAQSGIAVEALARQPGAATAAPPRYRNPADAAQTWSGRGRQPKWVTAALAAGGTLDQLRVTPGD